MFRELEDKKGKSRVVFVLPKPPVRIIGGYKVIYDYSNYLFLNGHDVNIYYDCSFIGKKINLKSNVIKKLDGIRLLKKVKWVKLQKGIKSRVITSAQDIKLNNSDVVFATAVTTVHILEEMENRKDIYRCYFIQDLETWDESINVYETYKLDIYKIVVSSWLKDLVDYYSNGNKVFLCKNGIDTEFFRVIHPIKERSKHSICFMYHHDERKGIPMMIKIIKKLRNKYSDLIINSFGAFDKPDFLTTEDTYISYANREQLLTLYNQSAVFICTSNEEGFGLTGAESMACGCALVTTETNGSKEYANNANALISKVGDIDKMLENICLAFDNNELRIKIANQGAKDIKSFGIEIARDTFCTIIDEISCK